MGGGWAIAMPSLREMTAVMRNDMRGEESGTHRIAASPKLLPQRLHDANVRVFGHERHRAAAWL